MRVGIQTLLELKHAGDSDATQAYKYWIQMAHYNRAPVTVACFLATRRF